ncbi:hypothetical protein [Pseudomonas donghuensis]|uniref:hypothetical protein n=1 Tax=Pseudomonas donghuensis TaxID=1163398 RepID=UPI0016777D3C|nr:hypothetical protein [Pseudomonas donghuensis]WKY31148.1 hypothetical protein QYF67_00770 [Pseudomonas donghuensis]
MKKIVPDPPLDTSAATAHSVFGNCQAGHSALFAVCSGVAAHDALVHASLYLRCAYDTGKYPRKKNVAAEKPSDEAKCH